MLASLLIEKNVQKKYNQIKRYLDSEIKIIENLGYIEGSKRLNTFSRRAKKVILNKNNNYYVELPKSAIEKILVEKVLYLHRVSNDLEKRSQASKYWPSEGSYWESIGEVLKKLSSEIKEIRL